MNLLLHSSITFLMFKLERSQTAGPGEEDPVWSHRDSSRRPWNEAAGGFIPGETWGLTKVSEQLSSVLKFVFFIINVLIIHVTFTQPTVCFLPVQMMALFCFLYMVYCRVQLSGDKHSAPSSLSFFPSCYEQSMEHLSWLGLFKDLSERTQKASPFYHKRALRKTPEECEHVREKYLQMRFEPTHWAQTIVLYVCRNKCKRCSLRVLKAVLWRYRKKWGSTWRPRPSITGTLRHPQQN